MDSDRSLAARLMAHVGGEIHATVVGVGVIDGELSDSTATWCEIAGARTWYVPHSSIVMVRGMRSDAARASTWPHLARLSFASPLRHLAEGREQAIVHMRDGTRSEGFIAEVGVDYVEMLLLNRSKVVLTMAHVASASKGGISPAAN